MAEYSNAAAQTVAQNSNVLFSETEIPCNRGLIIHREGSGLFTLRSAQNACFARYVVTFGANIAVPTGGTAGEIGLSIAINGEALAPSTMLSTPAAIGDFNYVGRTETITVPNGCCLTVSVRNISDQAITVQNANINITRVA